MGRDRVVVGLLVLLMTLAAPATASAEAAMGRYEGATRYETAIRIAQASFPGGAGRVYLARGDDLSDALTAGALTDGPVLLVPRCGTPPDDVTVEVARLRPETVTVLGGTQAVCDETAAHAADGRPMDRLAGDGRIDTAIEVSRAGFPDRADEVYLATAATGPDAVVAGALTGGPILLVPATGPVPSSVTAEIDRLDPRRVVAIGGTAVISEATLASAADGRLADRAAGPTRFETAVAVAQRAFPDGAPTAYLARADVFADAVAAGALRDGPVLLVPRCGRLPDGVAAEIARLASERVVALGGPAAVCDLMHRQAAGTPPPEPVAATDPGALADQLLTAEQLIRTGSLASDWERAMGELQQVVYRRMRPRPQLDGPVLGALPADVRAAAEANLEAGRALGAMVTELKDEPPDHWRIVAPPPAEELLGYYREGETAYGVPWEYLAAIHLVETRMSRIEGTSTAGAQGPMQFMPATWEAYGGGGDIHDDRDAIIAAARYLAANGAPQRMANALWHYNHDDRYVLAVTRYAQQMVGDPDAYLGYYHWQVWYLTTQGEILLPVGWEGDRHG